MRIISICNQKGGCAKTTTAINIAAELALEGHKVLMIDNDYQANLTAAFGITDAEYSLYDVFTEEVKLKDIIVKTTVLDTLDLVPSNINFSGFELAFADDDNNKTLLKDILKKSKLKYDYIIIDCPPSLNLAVVNAMTVSNDIIIPLEASLFNYQGLSNLLKIISMIKQGLNKKLNVAGIVLTRVDSRTKLGKEFVEPINKIAPGKLFNTKIHQSTAVVRSQLCGLPISLYDPRSRASKEYKELVKEIVNNA